jgi:hypothetical protein
MDKNIGWLNNVLELEQFELNKRHTGRVSV